MNRRARERIGTRPDDDHERGIDEQYSGDDRVQRAGQSPLPFRRIKRGSKGIAITARDEGKSEHAERGDDDDKDCQVRGREPSDYSPFCADASISL